MTENKEEQLKLIFDPRTIEHLGIKMYSQLPYALAELVANGYDASADSVEIKLYDNLPDSKKIVVIDNGDGMSFDEIKDKFLVVGRKRRDQDSSRENSKQRKITGKKGLGKLALFGIGKHITIETTKSGDPQKTIFSLNWEDILGETSGTYHPKTQMIDKLDINSKGTIITLTELTRVSGFDLQGTAVALSKLFNWMDVDFQVTLSKNDEEGVSLTRDLRYERIDQEFEWDVKKISAKITDDNGYVHRSQLAGKIISSKKPMKQDLRGITLYVNGRLANIPSFFGISEAGHTFSYLSGWIDADFLDECQEDLISTDRQSLSWDLPEAEALQHFLQKIIKFLVKDWNIRRKSVKDSRNSEILGINIRDWYDKIPTEMRLGIERIVTTILNKPELDDIEYSKVVKDFYATFPPYTYYHYRHLHQQVRDASEHSYQSSNYYEAFQEALKRYKNYVKDKSGVDATEDSQIVVKAFGKDPEKPLKTTAKFKKRPNGAPFSKATLDNIEEGQRSLSQGVVQGGRNVLSHEEHCDLQQTGLFTEKDCLDLLSLLSHLFKRLDESEKLP